MKRVVIGVLLATSVVFGGVIISDKNGRYEFGQVGEVRADQYMLDTRTGRLWNIMMGSKYEIPYLVKIFYQGGMTRPDDMGIKNSDGRYKFHQISEYRRDQYMLDTKTGRLWMMVQKSDSNETILEPFLYDNFKYVPDEINK